MAELLHHVVFAFCILVIATFTYSGFVPNWIEDSSVFAFSLSPSASFSYSLHDQRSWKKGPFRMCVTVNETAVANGDTRHVEDSVCGWVDDSDINGFRNECFDEIKLGGTGSSSTITNGCDTGYYEWMSVRAAMIGAVASSALAVILLGACYISSIARSKHYARTMIAAGVFIMLAVIGTGGTVGVWLAMVATGSGTLNYGFYLACGGCMCSWCALVLWCVHHCTSTSQLKADQNMNRMTELNNPRNSNNNVNTLCYYPPPQPQPQPYYQYPQSQLVQQSQPLPPLQPFVATNNVSVAVELPTTTYSSSSSSAVVAEVAPPNYAASPVSSPDYTQTPTAATTADDDDCKEYNYDNPLKSV